MQRLQSNADGAGHQETKGMRVLLINSVCGIGSTGRICTDLAQAFEADGYEVKIAFGRDGSVPERFQKYAVRIGTDLDVRIHGVLSRLFDAHGLGSKRATKRFLEWAEAYHPDLLWLHNIHGYYINYEMLFSWIKKHPEMEVRWTLHDCWAFTGHCSYFSMVDCGQWKEHCSHCLQKKRYPASIVLDRCGDNFERKKAAFTGVSNMTLITPSQWLADLVKQSFLKEYPVEVRYNTVDTSIFKPTPSDFRERHGLTDKKIVLGVASAWDDRKGLDDFIKLAAMLDDHYTIVLVGLSKKQIREMPKRIGAQPAISKDESKSECPDQILVNEKGMIIPQSIHAVYKAIAGAPFAGQKGKPQMICIKRTNNPRELAEIYTAADFFVNATHEDNYPTVNLEATACGTFVISYDTGGCCETIQKPNMVCHK